mmetsp:Transcript_21481/g.49834  ORF Transcript_21481/g.49834 Transcript_21481/m.49834 type:complete len:206 (+) Transcript_21481:523-1140(+)
MRSSVRQRARRMLPKPNRHLGVGASSRGLRRKWAPICQLVEGWRPSGRRTTRRAGARERRRRHRLRGRSSSRAVSREVRPPASRPGPLQTAVPTSVAPSPPWSSQRAPKTSTPGARVGHGPSTSHFSCQPQGAGSHGLTTRLSTSRRATRSGGPAGRECCGTQNSVTASTRRGLMFNSRTSSATSRSRAGRRTCAVRRRGGGLDA